MLADVFVNEHLTIGSMAGGSGSASRSRHLLEGKRFFNSEATPYVGYIDVAASVLAYWLDVMEEVMNGGVLRLLGEDDDEFPALRRWAKDYTSHEAVKPCLPDRDKLVVYFADNKDRYTSMAKAAAQ
ncbi:hypothetical protein PR202_gb28388 [Eleusine coracana subsp. coracana]|uniref:GST C-terminal domain-containing protein n=1 Tax=Eleusine coracana subsp. coracana TaxID=191504 RepID=A0AAV5FW93_ELECO|nr:hypothetical protein PR202_gb28388 [Eleusine coracana subsp. coracana]